jgi:predicted acylesterase/phospholipase RssA
MTETNSSFTIVEACLATSAAPLIFSPLQKDHGGSTELFIDGGLGYNNPVGLLLRESAAIQGYGTAECLSESFY